MDSRRYYIHHHSHQCYSILGARGVSNVTEDQMLSRLRPLKMAVSAEERSYLRGETVDIRVEIKANRDTEVREGRLDLVCKERYTTRP